jgi:hypothetical protein
MGPAPSFASRAESRHGVANIALARCSDPIDMTRSEYEVVRSVPVRFAIALNHENPEIDRVVFENPWFATVEKFYGAGSRIARASDPRG